MRRQDSAVAASADGQVEHIRPSDPVHWQIADCGALWQLVGAQELGVAHAGRQADALPHQVVEGHAADPFSDTSTRKPITRSPTTYLAVLDGHPSKFAPIERFSYCNSGYVVLALHADYGIRPGKAQ